MTSLEALDDDVYLAARDRRDRESEALFAQMVALAPGSAQRARLRGQLIELYRPLAEQMAGKFGRHGREPMDDLVQVASLALIKAVDGFDPERGTQFPAYAIPYIVGELKRHFRDRTWDVRVPRRLQELTLGLTAAADRLTQELGRSPTVADLAGRLGVSEEEIIEGLASTQAYRASSLNAPAIAGDGDLELGDLIGEPDRGFDSVENSLTLNALVARLPPREQRIIALRFHGNLTQTEIAAELGISQMHVSRLLSQALRRLREGLLED